MLVEGVKGLFFPQAKIDNTALQVTNPDLHFPQLIGVRALVGRDIACSHDPDRQPAGLGNPSWERLYLLLAQLLMTCGTGKLPQLRLNVVC